MSFQQEENKSQGVFVTGDSETFLDKPSEHNRTTRQANHWCVKSIERTWDKCRNKFVDRFKCYTEHVSCLKPNSMFVKPSCQTVYGFREAKFFIVTKCKSLPIDCKCAA